MQCNLSRVVCIRQQGKDPKADYRGRQEKFSEFIVQREDNSSQAQLAGPGYRKQKLKSTDKRQHDNYNDLTREQRIWAIWTGAEQETSGGWPGGRANRRNRSGG